VIMKMSINDITSICDIANVNKKIEFDASSFKMNHKITEGDVRIVLQAFEHFRTSQEVEVCPACEGDGWERGGGLAKGNHPCLRCRGTGKLNSRKE